MEMTELGDAEAAARGLVAGVLGIPRGYERAVRLRPIEWMGLMESGGMTVMALPDYQRLEAALEAAFPDRFAGPLGTHDLPSQFIWALVDGVVLTAASGYFGFEVPPAEVSAAIGEMVELIQRNSDRVVAARASPTSPWANRSTPGG